jgi:hypothetical protein
MGGNTERDLQKNNLCIKLSEDMVGWIVLVVTVMNIHVTQQQWIS